MTLQVGRNGPALERWYCFNPETGEVIEDGPMRWESIAEANIETTAHGLPLNLEHL